MEYTADAYGNTPLHAAAAAADLDSVRCLLAEGADPNALNGCDKTALHRLEDFGDWEEEPQRVYDCAMALLEAGCNPSRRDESGKCFYHDAAYLGNYPLFEALRDSGKRVNAALSSTGETALHLAARGMHMYDYLRGDAEYDEMEGRYVTIIQALLAAGLDPEAETHIGKKPLDFAVEVRAKRVAALLKDGVLDESTAAIGGMTLHQAAWQEDEAAIAALLAQGADPNEVADDGDHKGLTPLMTACEALRPTSARLLLEGGADSLFRDGETGRTALWALCHTLNIPVRIPGGRVNEARFSAVLSAVLTDPRAASQPLDGAEGQGLHLVCQNLGRSWWVGDTHAHKLLVPALLRAGADPNAADQAGCAPLHYLCRHGDDLAQDLLMTLLEKGARLDQKDGQGRLPIHYAADLRDGPAALAMAETMLDFADVDFSAPDNSGKTALDLAADHGHTALLKRMLS